MTSFQDLLPDRICDSVAAQGFKPTGQLFQLNSYENRVYQVGLEGHAPVIVKFYRPGRWAYETLADEHHILSALADAEIPVVAPIALKNPLSVPTLALTENYYYCLYPKFGGHEEADLSHERLAWLGRTLARVHNVTSSLKVRHRLELNETTYGTESLKLLQVNPHVPEDLRFPIEKLILDCLEIIKAVFKHRWQKIVVHGDCHLGNVLWNQAGPTLVDFDDAVLAPPVQDVWMLFSGSAEEQREQMNAFFSGYETFRDFDEQSLILTEPLRTLRMIRHAAWIGQRFEEAIFQKTFPYYSERKYWENFLLSLKEQMSLLQEIHSPAGF